MKQCPSCETKNKNDAAFCSNCGAELKDVPVSTDDWAAAAGSFLNKAKEAAAIGAEKVREAAATGAEKAKKAMEEADKKAQAAKAAKVSAGGWDSANETQNYVPNGGGAGPQKGANILVDQSESIVSTIGNNYLQNFLSGGTVKQGVGVLTQKRFYYKGRNFSGTGKDMKSSTNEGVVSVDDITFTQFIYTRHTGLLIAGIICTVLCLLMYAFIEAIEDELFVYIFLFQIPAAIFFYIMYFVRRQTLFLVCFPGGSFGFDIRYYPISDIRDFQRQLHLLKDHRKEDGNL